MLRVSVRLPCASGVLMRFSSGVGLLHTIIFNRALGAIKPVEVDSELFDVTYVRPRFQLCPRLPLKVPDEGVDEAS
jgi:hypothetical protein